MNSPDQCALPVDEEGNYSRAIRTVRQDAQENRRWPVQTALIVTGEVKQRRDGAKVKSLQCEKKSGALRKDRHQTSDSLIWLTQTFRDGGAFAYLLAF